MVKAYGCYHGISWTQDWSHWHIAFDQMSLCLSGMNLFSVLVFLCLIFFNIKLTKFGKCHMGFANIFGTLLVTLTNVSYLLIQHSKQVNTCVIASPIVRKLATYKVWNIWIYSDATMTDTHGIGNIWRSNCITKGV